MISQSSQDMNRSNIIFLKSKITMYSWIHQTNIYCKKIKTPSNVMQYDIPRESPYLYNVAKQEKPPGDKLKIYDLKMRIQ